MKYLTVIAAAVLLTACGVAPQPQMDRVSYIESGSTLKSGEPLPTRLVDVTEINKNRLSTCGDDEPSSCQ